MLIGFLGLGKMGGRMVSKLLQGGHDVVAWNRSIDVSEEFVKQYALSKATSLPARQGSSHIRSNNISLVKNISDFVLLKNKPHVFWSMVQYGEPTKQVLLQLLTTAEKGDVVIDGANSFYLDTQKQYEAFTKKGIHFLGIGVSGGILAPVNGFPLMAGGSETGYKKIQPILDTLSKPHGGHAYFGKGGVGHFIKMVHNGVEYGMMQAIGEGFGVLEKGPYLLDLEKVADLWTKETIVSGFLMDCARDALVKDPQLAKTAGFIEENGEAKWTIALAKKLRVPIEIIEASLQFRQKSQKSLIIQKSFAAKMVAALRHEFGGHKIKET